MNSLFASLYLDEDVSILLADIIRARGFDVVTTRDAGQLGGTDADQLSYAVMNQSVMVTHNRADFEVLHQSYLAENRTHWGIIIAVRRPPYQVGVRLLRILDSVTADEFQNQLVYV